MTSRKDLARLRRRRTEREEKEVSIIKLIFTVSSRNSEVLKGWQVCAHLKANPKHSVFFL